MDNKTLTKLIMKDVNEALIDSEKYHGKFSNRDFDIYTSAYATGAVQILLALNTADVSQIQNIVGIISQEMTKTDIGKRLNVSLKNQQVTIQ
jgi:hypothetical protein